MSEPRRFRLTSTLGLAVMLVVGLALGLGAGLLVPASKPGDDSAEAGFARDMSAHHAQAVQLGMIAAERATDPAVRVLGGDIALTQQAQIGMMSQWLREWGLNVNGAGPRMAWMPDAKALPAGSLMPGMASQDDIAKLEAAKGVEVDKMFLDLMIKHHLGGIHMVEGALKLSDNADIQWLAGTMKAGQQREVGELEKLQTELAAK